MPVTSIGLSAGTTSSLVLVLPPDASSLRTGEHTARPPARSLRRPIMETDSCTTEVVVREHLPAFLEQAGVDAIVKDYHDEARLYGEAKIYHGKHEIHGFFVDFLDALPAGGLERFELRSVQVEETIAYITWRVGDDIALGTDPFLGDDPKIVSRTFAMHRTPAD